VNYWFLFYKYKSYFPFDLTTYDQNPKLRNVEGRNISEEWIKLTKTEVVVYCYYYSYFTATVL